MTNDTSLGAGNHPSPGAQPRADAQQEEMLNLAKADFTRRLHLLNLYTDMFVGFPDRKPPYLSVDQLRDEWRREGVIINAVLKNVVRAGNALLEAIEQKASVE